jgi:hypothetical protein
MMAAWSRARDVLGGEEAVKAAGEKYLVKLASQSDEEYQAYKMRAAFFNATVRTLAGDWVKMAGAVRATPARALVLRNVRRSVFIV